jgi:hypothetical protein
MAIADEHERRKHKATYHSSSALDETSAIEGAVASQPRLDAGTLEHDK